MRVKWSWCVGFVCCASLIGVARAQVSPQESIKSFKLADGLECTLFAAEPMLVNPADMDIDSEPIKTTIRTLVQRQVAVTSTLPDVESPRGLPERVRRALSPDALKAYMAAKNRVPKG